MTSFSRWQLTCPECGAETPGGGATISARGALCVACWAAPPAAEVNGRGGAKLYGYQRDGVARLMTSPAWLLADEPGLGKTCQALVSLDGAAIVVCPPSVRRQWCREVGRWAPNHRVRLVEKRESWSPPKGLEVVVVAYTTIRGGVRTRGPFDPGTTLILDEAQSVKNPQAQQTQGARALSALVREVDGRVWLLTATPAYASPRECWEVLRAADLHRALHPVGTRWEEMDPDEQARRLAKVMLRRRSSEVLDLPPLRWQRINVELPTAVSTQLDDAARMAVARARLTDDGDTPTDSAVEAAAASMSAAEVQEAVEQLLDKSGDLPITTVRRLCALAKLTRVEELAAEHEESNTPLVVLADHRAPLEAIARRPRHIRPSGFFPNEIQSVYATR